MRDKLTITIDSNLKKLLATRAKAENRSISNLLEAFIEKLLKGTEEFEDEYDREIFDARITEPTVSFEHVLAQRERIKETA